MAARYRFGAYSAWMPSSVGGLPLSSTLRRPALTSGPTMDDGQFVGGRRPRIPRGVVLLHDTVVNLQTPNATGYAGLKATGITTIEATDATQTVVGSHFALSANRERRTRELRKTRDACHPQSRGSLSVASNRRRSKPSFGFDTVRRRRGPVRARRRHRFQIGQREFNPLPTLVSSGPFRLSTSCTDAQRSRRKRGRGRRSRRRIWPKA